MNRSLSVDLEIFEDLQLLGEVRALQFLHLLPVLLLLSFLFLDCPVVRLVRVQVFPRLVHPHWLSQPPVLLPAITGPHFGGVGVRQGQGGVQRSEASQHIILQFFVIS